MVHCLQSWSGDPFPYYTYVSLKLRLVVLFITSIAIVNQLLCEWNLFSYYTYIPIPVCLNGNGGRRTKGGQKGAIKGDQKRDVNRVKDMVAQRRA